MYENMTFEKIIGRCLERIDASLDKREGSVVYDMLAPASVELAIIYLELAYLLDMAFPDTATGDYLTKKCQEHSIFREPATPAIRKGYFTKADGSGCQLPLGARFSGDNINFVVTELIADGEYQLQAETLGVAGNEYTGTLFPIDYVPELAAARLADILIPGEDEESDDALRARYFASLEAMPFGGNIADYQTKVKALDGVGGVKVYPVWNGGGTVKLVIIDTTFAKPSPTLIDEVQTAIDPTQNHGQGVGLAPIGHVVTVVGCGETTVSIQTHLTFQAGWDWAAIEPYVTQCIDRYLYELAASWADTANTIVRISQIETRLLDLEGILDITDTSINGAAQNLSIPSDNIPVRGEITNVSI